MASSLLNPNFLNVKTNEVTPTEADDKSQNGTDAPSKAKISKKTEKPELTSLSSDKKQEIKAEARIFETSLIKGTKLMEAKENDDAYDNLCINWIWGILVLHRRYYVIMKYCRRVVKSFQPLRILMLIFFRLPFRIRTIDPVEAEKENKQKKGSQDQNGKESNNNNPKKSKSSSGEKQKTQQNKKGKNKGIKDKDKGHDTDTDAGGGSGSEPRCTIGGWEYYFEWTNPGLYLFVLSSSFLFLLGCLYAINFCGAVTNFPAMSGPVPDYFRGELCPNDSCSRKSPGPGSSSIPGPNPGPNNILSTAILRAEESFIIARNAVPFLLLLLATINGTAGAIWVFLRREFICFFLSYIVATSERVKINFAHGLLNFMRFFVGFYIFSLVLFVICCYIKFAPMTGGLQTMMVTMTYRLFYTPIHAIDSYALEILKFYHTILYIFIQINSKVYIFFFMWCCTLVKNGFIVWNFRVDSLLIRDEKTKPYNQREINRTFFHQLFTDHIMLLDLIEGIDRIFAGIAEVYYVTESVSICLEIYYVVHSQISAIDFQRERKLDSIVMMIYVLQSVMVLYFVTYAAADVNNEALEGLEVIRRRGFMGKQSDAELYFMMSMYVSFTGHFDICVVCANYVTMDRSFVLMLANTISMFIVMIVQLSPALFLSDNTKLILLRDNCRIMPGANPFPRSPLLWQTEGLYSFGRKTC